MVERDNYKKFIGNICLHQDLVVERRFLRRNLRTILDSHQRRLAYDGSYEDMIANEKRSSGWDFPTREMLEDLMRGQKPVLRLDSLQIRHPRTRARIQRRSRDQTNGDHGLDWLPDPNADIRLPCRVGISVVDTRTSRTRTEVQTVAATISQDGSTEDHPTYHIELRKPFLVEIDKFFVVEEKGSNGARTWKRTVTAKYALEITIQCQDSDDTAELLSRIESRRLNDYYNAPASEGLLKAIWEDLPECPPDGRLLALKRAKGHKLLELDYKLEVSMGWARKRESPLQRYNQKLSEVQKANRQLLTPSASDDLDKQATKPMTLYKHNDGLTIRILRVHGLFCPFCRNGREHSLFERLQLHLLTYHDHFQFGYEEEPKQGSSTIKRTISVSLAEKEDVYFPEIEDRCETIDINWTAPSRPFDIGAYVRGEDTWGRQGKTKSGTRKGKARRDKERDYVSAAAPQPIRKRPAPDDVEDLPEYRPYKRQVPNVPGVSFYHTTSKQVLSPGEYVAESDEYVDESWLEQNEKHGLEELGIIGPAQQFVNTFNKHLAREQSDSSILVREALVRFARIHHERLQDIEWQRQFRAKLNQLREAGIIGDQTVSYCVRALRAGSEVRMKDVEAESTAGADGEADGSGSANGLANGENGILQRDRRKWMGSNISSRESKRSSKGKAPMVNGDASCDRHSVGYEDIDGETPGINGARHMRICTCGSSANHTRASIACMDPRCVRKDYHLACVGLDRRVIGWRCAECAA